MNFTAKLQNSFRLPQPTDIGFGRHIFNPIHGARWIFGPARRLEFFASPVGGGGKFRLRNDNFACELKNFACETILFRQATRKLLKSFGYETYGFAVSCDLKGLRPILFRACFFAVRFPIRPVGLALF
jgi:hypothetical protein